MICPRNRRNICNVLYMSSYSRESKPDTSVMQFQNSCLYKRHCFLYLLRRPPCGPSCFAIILQPRNLLKA